MAKPSDNVRLTAQLHLRRCPHCGIASPLLVQQHRFSTDTHTQRNERTWGVYVCQTCGGVVTAASDQGIGYAITELYPDYRTVDESIPEPSRTLLDQSLESLAAPAGAVMLAASAIDAMLKAKSLKSGSLYARIDQAAEEHLITSEMAAWAHEVRLDANDQRHADETAGLPDAADARKCVNFALSLAEFLFVLPARVARGRKGSGTR